MTNTNQEVSVVVATTDEEASLAEWRAFITNF